MKTISIALCTGALALVPTLATAQPTYDPVPVAVEDPPPTFFQRYGVSLMLGGGVEGFTGDTLRETTTDGGNWGVRAAIGSNSMLGFEASYIGSAQEIDALGLEGDSVLLGNGAQAAIRFNATVDSPLQPFLYGGLAWRHYSIEGTDVNNSDIADSDDVLEVPLGIGLAYKTTGGFVIDARGEFRAATEEDLMAARRGQDDGSDADMHRWGVNANVGYEF